MAISIVCCYLKVINLWAFLCFFSILWAHMHTTLVMCTTTASAVFSSKLFECVAWPSQSTPALDLSLILCLCLPSLDL